MQPANQRDIITLSTVSAFLGIASLKIPLLYEFLHVLVNSFAGGRSGVKVVLFFSYISLLGVIALTPRQKESNSKRLVWIGCISTVGALVVGLIAQTHFSYQNDLTQKDIAVVFNLGEISSTRLLHNHIFKGIFGSILHFFGKGSYENIDAGLAFVGIVPAFYFIAGGILFLLSITSHILYFKKRFPYKDESWKNLLFIIIYGICSFTLLKNIIDGGIFNYETAACIISLSFLLASSNVRTKHNAVKLISIYILIYSYLLYLGAFSNTTQYLLTLLHILAITSVFAVCAWIYASSKITRLHILLSIFSGLLMVPTLNTDIDIATYRRITIPEDSGAIIAMYQKKNDPHYTALENIGPLHLYHFLPGKKTVTIATILEKNKLLDNLYPISIPWNDCFPEGKPTQYTFTLFSQNNLEKNTYYNHNFLYIKANPITKTYRKGWKSYEMHATIKSCLPRHVNILEEGLKLMGAKTFILTKFETE